MAKGNNGCKFATHLSTICYAVVNNLLPRFPVRQKCVAYQQRVTGIYDCMYDVIPLNTSALENTLHYGYICKDLLVSKHANIELRGLNVKNLSRKYYRICCVIRQESIHAVAYFPTRAKGASGIAMVADSIRRAASWLDERITWRPVLGWSLSAPRVDERRIRDTILTYKLPFRK